MWGGRNGLRVLGAQWWLRGSLTCRRRIGNKPCCVSKSRGVPDHRPSWVIQRRLLEAKAIGCQQDFLSSD